jgi:hypothetical protein
MNLLQPSPRRRDPLLVATKLHIITHHAAAIARAFFTSAVAAAMWTPPGRYQFSIMQRGPPRIGFPHLVATKFKLCSRVLYLRALGIPHLVATKFTNIQRKEQDKTAKQQQQRLF